MACSLLFFHYFFRSFFPVGHCMIQLPFGAMTGFDSTAWPTLIGQVSCNKTAVSWEQSAGVTNMTEDASKCPNASYARQPD
ncbi:hypothetical protein BDF22DRAFT_777322 [Syncephalis plumigaleata]|nr:hypothetical protein BDF22DRAFT_777322 [Syncephalis plumigaleata]